jgi:hypothetical protein
MGWTHTLVHVALVVLVLLVSDASRGGKSHRNDATHTLLDDGKVKRGHDGVLVLPFEQVSPVLQIDQQP